VGWREGVAHWREMTLECLKKEIPIDMVFIGEMIYDNLKCMFEGKPC